MALAEHLWRSLPKWRFYRNPDGAVAFLSEIDCWSVGAQGAMFAVMQHCAEHGCVLPCVERLEQSLHALMAPLEDDIYGLLFAERDRPEGHLLALHAFVAPDRVVPTDRRIEAERRLRSTTDR